MTGYELARRGAIQHLKTKAREGKIEAGFLLDMDTGRQLDYTEANEENPDEITFSAELTGVPNAAVLYCHRDDTPPGPDDWKNFIHQTALREMVIVTPQGEYAVTRPVDWKIPAGETPDLTFFRFQAHLERIRRAAGHPQGFAHLPVATQQRILRETNKKMADFYGVNLSQED